MKEIKRVVRGFRRGILDGEASAFMCYAVCAPLQGYLATLGVHTELEKGEVECSDYNVEHFWLRLPDGQIIDPTADQFLLQRDSLKRMPQVYIGPLPKWYVPARETGT